MCNFNKEFVTILLFKQDCFIWNMREIVYPQRIMLSQGLTDEHNLLKKQPLQIGLSEKYVTKFSENSTVILDFGKEMCGGVRILTRAGMGTKIHIRFGESLSETCTEVFKREFGPATNHHSVRDFETTLMSLSDMTFANTGYRYVRIDVVEGEATIKSIVGTNNILSKREKWKYSGDDELIKKIYQTAKRTIDLCAGGDYVWDGVKRDRLVWIGDMHPEMLAITTMYGSLKNFERSLDFVKDQTPIPTWMNGSPPYSMWWIIIIADYLRLTQNVGFVRRQLAYLDELLDLLNEHVDEEGNMSYPYYFVDWPTKDKEDEIPGVRAINILAAKGAIQILKRFQKDTSKAELLLKKLLKQEIVVKSQKQVAALKYFATGLNDEDKKLLLDGGAKGMSTFMSYYILKAIASFDKPRAIEIMKEYYGKMLEKGATTFWEDFDMSWAKNSNDINSFAKEGEKDIHGDFGAYCYLGYRHSLCHGWSAGVIAFIKEECC